MKEKSIMEELQDAAERYFSGPIPDGSAYLGENIRKNYRVIQRAAAEWGAKWIAEKAGVKTHNPTPIPSTHVGGPRWVRASERHGPLEKFLSVKDSEETGGLYRTGNFYQEEDGSIFFDVTGNECYKSFTIPEAHFHSLWWLEENSQPVETHVGGMRWVKASDHLPRDTDRHVAKGRDGSYHEIRVDTHGAIRIGGQRFFSKDILEEWHPGIEWLDESPQPKEPGWKSAPTEDKGIIELLRRMLVELQNMYGDEWTDYANGCVNDALAEADKGLQALPVEEGVGFDNERFFDNHKYTMRGVVAGEYLDKEDFDKLFGWYKDLAQSQQRELSSLRTQLSQVTAERDTFKTSYGELYEEREKSRESVADNQLTLEYLSKKMGINIPILVDAAKKDKSGEAAQPSVRGKKKNKNQVK
jgi:hypothetical protein